VRTLQPLVNVRNEPGLCQEGCRFAADTILIMNVRKAPGLICQEGSRSHIGSAIEFVDIQEEMTLTVA
jgi:hypothetical protein